MKLPHRENFPQCFKVTNFRLVYYLCINLIMWDDKNSKNKFRIEKLNGNTKFSLKHWSHVSIMRITNYNFW